MENDLIAALATPLSPSALAVIRTSGPQCVEAIASLTDRAEKIRNTEGGRIRRAHFIDPGTNEVIDEVMVAVFRTPRSYTGEDLVEIFSHGSVPGIRRILQQLYQSGFRPADPGEFTQRAFLAGKVDLTRAEAINEIVNAQTETGFQMAVQRLGGSIEHAVTEIRDDLVRVMASVAIQLDYPEEETGEIPVDLDVVRRSRSRLKELMDTYQTGKLYQDGARVVLAGRTNAGKSSLFNAFLKEERAIVSEIHGTTRDYISSRINVHGIPVELFDTAGLRSTTEVIEEEGIRRTRDVATGADIVVYVVDGTEGLSEGDREHIGELGGVADPMSATPPSATADADQPPRRGSTTDTGKSLRRGGGRVVPVWNKSDHRECKAPPGDIPFITVSSRTLQGVDGLVSAIAAALEPAQKPHTGVPVIDSLRQKNSIERTIAALDEFLRGAEESIPVDALSVDLQDALHGLGEITGEVTSEDILDAVFSGFCVGK